MKTKRITHAILLGGSICISSSVSAQDWLRDWATTVLPYKTGAGEGWVRTDGSTLVWTLAPSGSQYGPVTATLPFTHPGSIAQLGDNHFLVSGLNIDHSASPPTASGGALVLVELMSGPRSISIVATQPLVGRDFERMYYSQDEHMLYAYDSMQEQLVVGPVGAQPEIPPVFVVIDSASASNYLSRNALIDLSPTDSGVGVVVRRNGRPRSEHIFGTEYSYVGTGWSASPLVDGGAASGWRIWSQYENALAPTIAVGGAQGGFALALVGGGDVASATSLDPSVKVDVPLTPGIMVPGGSYYVRSLQSGVEDSPRQVVNSVWGNRIDTGSLTLQRDLTRGLYVGNAEFAVSARAMWVDAAVETVAVRNCFLVIGLYVPGVLGVTVDPVTGLAAIQGILGIVGPIPVEVRGTGQGHIVVPLPIPPDPGLEGLHLVLQWAADDQGELVWTEAYGSLIFPAPVTTAAVTTMAAIQAGGASAGQGSGIGTMRSRAESWIKSLPHAAWNQEKREFIKRWKTSD